MTLAEFKQSLKASSMPANLSAELQSLWCDGKGDWQGAHELIQDVDTKNAAWIHAYLHRKEGDLGNAGYWYRRANKEVATSKLSEEWEELVRYFLTEGAY
jgi:hypothetical protein